MNRLLPILLIAVTAACLPAVGSASSSGRVKGYWTAIACAQEVQKHLLPTTDGPSHNFWDAQAICVGRGGQQTCEWSADGASRLYAAFTVFTRSNVGGVVRSFTLHTHSGHGVPAWGKSSEPPPFYLSSVRLIATDLSPARFRSVVGPIAAQVARQQNAKGCAPTS